MTDHGTQRIKLETFKMNVTEAIRAHNNHAQNIAAKHYENAADTAINNYAPLQDTLYFLSTQAESSTNWTLGQSINNAIKGGYEQPLRDITALIDDPRVRETLDECIKATHEGRKALTGKFNRELINTSSGKYRLP